MFVIIIRVNTCLATGANRDVKKTCPHRYSRVIVATGQVLGEDFAPVNTRILNGAGAEITIPIPASTRYEIIILSLSY